MAGNGSSTPRTPSIAGKVQATLLDGRTAQVTLQDSRLEERRKLLEKRTGDRYVVGDELGRGGMGVVHRAVDRDLRRMVALKVMKGEQLSGMFVRESQVTAQLEHPNIVPVHDVGVTGDGNLFFTMKVVGGRSFWEVLNEAHSGVRPVRPLLEILAKACDAVAFAHSRGVVHRDLKPANVMVGEFGEVLVMDWGLAAIEDLPEVRSEQRVEAKELGMSLDGTVVGTPSYMPPEQARGETVDGRADVYALGAMLYHILVGVPPVTGKSLRELLVKAESGAFPTPLSYVEELETREPTRARWLKSRGVPAELSAIAMKALARERKERYQTVTAFRDDLRRYLEGREVLARRDPLLARVMKWIRRHPLPTAAAAAGLAALIVGVALARANTAARRHQEYTDHLNAAAAAKNPDEALAEAYGALSLKPESTEAQRLIEETSIAKLEAEEARRRRQAEETAAGLVGEAEAALTDLAAPPEPTPRQERPQERRDRQALIMKLLGAEEKLREAHRLLAPFGGGPVERRYDVNREMGIWALAGGDYTLARTAFSVCASVDPTRAEADALDQKIVDAEQALDRFRKERTQAALKDLREGLSRKDRPRGAPNFDDYVFEIVAYRDPQIIELLADAIRPLAEKAEAEGKRAVWTQEERDVLDFAFTVMGRPGGAPAVEPLAKLMDVLWDHRLATACGRALCRTRSAEARRPLLRARGRLGIGSSTWILIQSSLTRIPAPEGDPELEGPIGWIERAKDRMERGDPQGALEDCNRALEDGPHPDAFLGRGLAKVQMGDHEDAIEDFDRAIQLAPEAHGTWRLRGVAKHKLGDIDGAIKDLDRAIELTDTDARPLVDRAVIRLQAGDLDGAVRNLSQAIELDPYLVHAYTRRATAFILKGDLTGAIRDCTRAIELDPNLADAYINRGAAYASRGEWDAAIRDQTRAIELMPNRAGPFSNRGMARAKSGDIDGAIEDHTRAVELAPNDWRVYTNRGGARHKKGDFEGAIEDLTRALELGKPTISALGNRALSYQALGKLPEAIADWEAAVKVNPRHPTASLMRGWIEAAKKIIKQEEDF